MSPCPGCCAELAPHDGPTHRYIGASAACWDRYGRLLAGVPAIAPGSRSSLLVDAYAAQHPGTPSPQAIQSVACHLVTLEAVLTGRRGAGDGVRLRARAVERGRDGSVTYGWLEPRPTRWPATIVDVLEGRTPEDRAERLDRWVHGVWEAWSDIHGEVISSWTDQVLAR